VLAKEILHSRKAVTRLYTNKAHMMSISNALTEQLGARPRQCPAAAGCT
jgi:charged multivesicular body protein 3